MAPKPAEVIRFVARSTRRIAVSAVGGALVVAGLAMLVLPGPGILVVALGFAVLGTEYAWAAAALERTKRTARQVARAARDGVDRMAGPAKGAAGSVGRRGPGARRRRPPR